MGKGFNLALAVALVATLAGCTSTTGGGFCATSSPLRFSAKAVDTLSDTEARALLGAQPQGREALRMEA